MCKSKFDDWSDVKDCNDCEHYWNKLCDGVPEGSERPCTAFKATRRVDIPLEIKSLRKRLNWLYVSLIGMEVVVILHLLGHIMGWV